ncbi:hypothetical protein [Hymenobacter chitinivorans]|uniref:Uncharacterized protein n=1 Tax=Hymenobacter chitinivorans DSM 11115 TaxID=1121954 RepID=A0A2M9BTH3_9BACT|nr:hypothetical protein [Hymenobacter chitinivorans]PJJ61233.1 hypothetical protein CLV45_2671 [Hymenobacter chitinivorans DSM 11115]
MATNSSRQPAAGSWLAAERLVPPHWPRPVSPRAHAYFDLLAFPAIMSLAAWMWPRNRKAALLIAANGLLEGTTAAFTNFPPPGPFPRLSFRQHIRIGLLGAPLYLLVGSLVPGIPGPRRAVVLGLGVLPIVLNSLSNPVEPAPAGR